MKGDYKYYSQRWKDISPSAQSLIDGLLKKDPIGRLSAAKAMEHRWFTKFYPPSKRYANEDILKPIHDSIVQYSAFNDIKKIGLYIIAHQIESDHVWELWKAFDMLSKAKDGTISSSDFTSMMRKGNPDYTAQDIRAIFSKITIISKKKLHYTEFLAASLGMQKELVTEDRLWRAFDRLDHEAKGIISHDNLKQLLGSDLANMNINALWEDQTFGTGITFDTFLLMFSDFIMPKKD